MGPIDPRRLPTQSLEWGAIKWYVSPAHTPGAVTACGGVVLLPGKGHERHNHPDSEEILYILCGEGQQIVDYGAPCPVRAGDTIYIPRAIFHSTINTGWTPLRLLAIYNPGGPEQALRELPDFREVPAGQVPGWSRS